MFKNQAEMIQAVYKALPYCVQIQNLDLNKPDQIIFDWRGTRYQVGVSGHLTEIDGHLLRGSDLSLLVQELIKVNFYGVQPTKS